MVINLRNVPADLHLRVKMDSVKTKVSIEKIIVALMDKAYPAPRMVQPLQKGGK